MLIALCISVLAFAMIASVVLLVRTELVYCWRVRALRAISRMAKQAITEGRYSGWSHYYARLDNPSYEAMVWDIAHWHFRDYYPDLTEGD